MKKTKYGSILMLTAMALTLLVACGGDGGNDGDDSQTADIGKYVGKWSCISLATYGLPIRRGV